jgi:biotin transport system ATP-binding protein
VEETLTRFGLSALRERSSHELSGGQKQLLALAGAFVRRPGLVIADEPTTYLDARNARRVADHLLADAGHRLILVTHDLALAARCDAAVLFAGGRVEAVGRPADVIAEYEAVLAC